MKKVITIDGPAESGKSTLAKNLSKKLGNFVLLDTGSYFRWATYLCLKDGIDLFNRREVYNHVKDKMNLEFENEGSSDEMIVRHKGKKINEKIFALRISQHVSEPAQHYLLRNLIKKQMRLLAKKTNVVLAGRDTGTFTFPEAKLKIYLVSDIEKRAKRRFNDMKKKGKEVSFQDILTQMKARDRRDSEEKDSPLKKPRSAVVVDNSDMTERKTLNFILRILEDKKIIS